MPALGLRFSKRTAWLCVAIVACIGLSLAATPMVSHSGSDVWAYALILISSTVGIAIARSAGCRSVGSSIIGGGAGCAIVLGVLFFLMPLLIPPEPGTVYKWGGGMGSAIPGFVLGLILGGFSGGIVGLVVGLIRRIP